MALSLFHVISHSIPLIDELKVYLWQSSWCPKALRCLWAKQKLQLLCKKIQILEQIVINDGIQMDAKEVGCILK